MSTTDPRPLADKNITSHLTAGFEPMQDIRRSASHVSKVLETVIPGTDCDRQLATQNGRTDICLKCKEC
jgi:hypothetical protein